MSFRITYSVLDADMAEINRQFDAAMGDVRRQAGLELPSWIAGGARRSGQTFQSRNPADTRQVLASVHAATQADLEQAVAAAHEAQKVWWSLGWQRRVALIKKAADLISERRLPLAAAMSLEVGKNRLESLGDVEESADLLRYYAQQVEDSQGFQRPLGKLSPNEDTRDVLKPFGVFGVISPFNFPTALAAGMSGAALAAGNAVILKPSDKTPWCAEGLYHCFAEAGLPPGVFQVLQGGADLGRMLVRHPGLDGIAFTGSAQVGLEIHAIMSKARVRPCLMELGGKNPAIVAASADLEAAVEGCARSAFGLSGQKCSALSRILVHRSLEPRFVEALVARAGKIVVGDPTRADVYMGPVIDAAAVARFERAAGEARSDGEVLFGGERPDGEALAHGHFVQPTAVRVPRGHRLTRDELFLPFVTVQSFDTFDDAIAMANDVDYGLTAGVFTRDQQELDAFFDRIEAGVTYANRKTGATTGAWPGVQSFTGWKSSGGGTKGGCGPYYVAQFAREQSQTRML
jgi:1-pyrroline-5-carboxylate dehydrogenase